VLDVLADEGIGGERSAGYGQFTSQIEPVPDQDWPGYSGADGGMLTLSLVHPTYAEAGQLARSWYSLTTRRGWVGTPGALAVRRADVVMLSEGSLLPTSPDELFGEMVDVTPPRWPAHVPRLSDPLVRWGYALSVGVRMPQEE
jgi:CRISPR-associated protein Csm4